MATVQTSIFQLTAAFFVAFILAHITTRYFERFEASARFPSPLVSPGPLQLPAPVQGRDYIPHRRKPTLPPGPEVPDALQVDAGLYETTPPMPPTPEPTPVPPSTTTLPYAMTNDNYLAFLAPTKRPGQA